MPLRLSTSDQDFEVHRFQALLGMKREASADVDQAVRGIIADVRARGDAALIDLSKKFDSIDLGKARAACDRRGGGPRSRLSARRKRSTRSPLRATASPTTISATYPQSETYKDALGVELGHRWTAVSNPPASTCRAGSRPIRVPCS